jgi:hypothetical protein
VSKSRDDFTKATVDTLAKRAGGLCSNPECRRPTFGANRGDDGVANVGVAAHITAASLGGPRYDPTLSPEQRRHQLNGIWLCQTHGKLVDSDDKHFTIEMLHTWKRTAEERSFRAIVALPPTPDPQPSPVILNATDYELIGRLGLPEQDDLESITSRLIRSARADLNAFKRTPGWPRHSILLNLRMTDEGSVRTFNASALVSAIETFNEIVIIAPPGTGKTTTLLQVTEAMLSAGSIVATFVPLGEWSSQSNSFFQSIVRRHAFTGEREEHLKLLAHFGRLVLVLDGWNELVADSRIRATHEIKTLQREFPDLGFVISTRRQALDVPISAPVIEIDILTEAQQLEIARTLRGQPGVILLDHAWRTPGVRDLVSIPLYLTSLLAHTKGETLPTTKEEILCLFVTEQERKADNTEVLRKTLSGVHTSILTAIAVETTCSASTNLSESRARIAVKRIVDKLIADDQLANAPQPTSVLDVLVSHHLLIQSGAETRELSFQHQQFQEWYASFEVDELMHTAAEGNQQARKKLRTDVLNIPAWEEPILFACERVSRAGTTGVHAVSAAILDTLGVDPLLASEMIYRSSLDVWEEIKDKIISFVGRWHTSGKVDRAVHFMVSTGRSDFALQIWPLISNEDSQVHLVALRAGRRFRPSVLGPQIQERIALLPEKVRKHIVSEIVHNSGMDGIELAARIARADNSPMVRSSAIEALLFRRADRVAAEVLREAPDEVWREVASRGQWEDIDDPDCAARLHSERQNYIKGETDPLRKVRVLLHAGRQGIASGLGSQVASLIEATDFPVKNHETGWMIQEAYRLCPSDVTTAILHRLQAGNDIPYGSKELLQRAGLEIDQGPVVDLVLNPNTPENITEAAVTIVGPQTVGKLVDEILAIDSKIVALGRPIDESTLKQFWRLSDLLSMTGLIPFFKAVLNRASTTDPSVIALLAERVMRHHPDRPEGRQLLDRQLYEEMVIAVERWGETILTNPSATRSQLADIACAIERLAEPPLLPVLRRMLIEDLARWKTAREKFIAGLGRGGPDQSDAQTSWTLQYRRAFVAIGNAQVVELMKAYLPDAGYTGFGEDAAWALKEIYDREKNPQKEKFITWGASFSGVKVKRIERQQGTDLESSEFAEAILLVVNDLSRPDAGESAHRHALKLANIAFRMPYGNKAETVEKLLCLPRPLSEKLTLLACLVQAGEIISADTVLDGIKELLEEAKTKQWLLDDNHGILGRWLEILPFSDHPEATLDALRLLEPNLRHPWKLRGLLSALSCAPSIKAEEVLKLLAQEDSRFLKESDWLTALDRRETVSAAHILLDLICGGMIIDSGGGFDTVSIAHLLTTRIRKYPEFRTDVYQRFRSLPASKSKAITERAIAEAADEDGVMVLLLGHALPDNIYTAVRNVAEGKRPSSNWIGTEEVFSAPLPELRKKLFAIACSTSEESKIAKACLQSIDELRDDYGVVESEPRHPDIHSGLPWPLEAAYS